MIYPSRLELIWTLICKYNIFNVLFIRNFSWYKYKNRPTLEKYDVHWMIILKGVILHYIDVEMSKFFATCAGGGGGYPRNPPPGTLPPCFNSLGVDTYDVMCNISVHCRRWRWRRVLMIEQVVSRARLRHMRRWSFVIRRVCVNDSGWCGVKG